MEVDNALSILPLVNGLDFGRPHFRWTSHSLNFLLRNTSEREVTELLQFSLLLLSAMTA